ncbi:hypothetical protein [Mesorhizobium sp. M0276]|uniref:hypothetical protein n=1 Tax=Mesorhizobium sp. M0276 TaxID=2956928 RepID=UPI003338092B
MSRLTVLGRKSIVEGSWLARMLRRKPLMLRRDRACEQDGTGDLGDDNEERRLSRSGASGGCMMDMHHRKLASVKEV